MLPKNKKSSFQKHLLFAFPTVGLKPFSEMTIRLSQHPEISVSPNHLHLALVKTSSVWSLLNHLHLH